MIHLAILSILTVLIAGSASLTFAFIVYLREKNPLFRHHLIIMLLITVNLVIIQAAYYFYSFHLFPVLIPWLRLLSALDSCLIIIQCIFVEYPAKITLRYRVADRVFKVLGILLMIVLLGFFFFYDKYYFIARNIVFVLLLSGLVINSFMVLFERNPRQFKDGFNWNFYTKMIFLLYLILLPVLFLIISNKNDLSSSLPYYFLVYPGIYFVIHLFSTIFLVSTILKPHYQIKSLSIDPSTLKLYGLSDREADIAARLIEGMSYTNIGQSLQISLETVKTHTKSIYRKTGVNKRHDLVKVFQTSKANGNS